MNGTAQLAFIRNGGETRRYHTWPVLRQQTVAEHSFHVAMICQWLTRGKDDSISASVGLLMAALTHDLAEHIMGDLPAPSKRRLPDYEVGEDRDKVPFRHVWGGIEDGYLYDVGLRFSNLTEQEKHWLKLADAAEGCFYCIRERAMGNKLIAEVYANFREYVSGIYFPDNDRELALILHIDSEWEKACG